MYRYSSFRKILSILVLFFLTLPQASFAGVADAPGVSNLVDEILTIATEEIHDRPSADVSGIALHLLVDSDQLICDAWIINASIALRNLIIADAGDPSVKRQQLIRKMSELRDKIEFACQKFVYNEHLGISDHGDAATAGHTTGEGPAPETPEPPAPPKRDPRYTVEEQICMERCGGQYSAYDRVRRDAIKASEDAERSRSELADARRRAASAHQEADQLRGPRNQAKAAYDQAVAQWERNGGSRSEVNKAMDREHNASTQYRRAELEAQERDAEVAAKTASVRVNQSYAESRLGKLNEAREAYLDCVQRCVSAAANAGATVDPSHLFRHFGESPAPVPTPVPAPQPTRDTRSSSIPKTPVAPPAGSVLHSPGYAFAGGTISGQVMGPDNEPVTNTQVQLTTITGSVIETKTDDQGRWESKVPSGIGGKLTASLVGMAGSIGAMAVMKVVTQTPKEIPAQPAHYLQPGQVVEVSGNYPEVALRDPAAASSTGSMTSAGQPVMNTGGTGVIGSGQPLTTANGTGMVASGQPIEVPNRTGVGVMNSGQVRIDSGANAVKILNQAGSVALPTVRSVSADGTMAITRYVIPNDLPSRQLLTVMTNDKGQTKAIDTSTFTAIGRLDNSKLRSGQQADFVYNFQFPAGEPRKVDVRIDTTGAIEYKDAGKIQSLKVGPDGAAQLKGRIRGTAGTPAGAPFAITPTVLQ